jgi:hypothetical protein
MSKTKVVYRHGNLKGSTFTLSPNDRLAVAMIMTLAAPKKDSSIFHHPKKHHFLDTMFLHFL